MSDTFEQPNFMIIGAPKAGTTSLFAQICVHPDVFPSFYKETHFFTDENLFARGKSYYAETFFNGAEKYKCSGEATPAYLRHGETVVPRLEEMFDTKTLKLIVVLRDPVERAWSHYLHRRRSLNEPLSFEAALLAEPDRLAAGEDFAGYFQCGLYGDQVAGWLNTFSRDQLLIVTNNDMRAKPELTLIRVFEYLGVEPLSTIKLPQNKNSAGAPRFRALMQFIRNPDAFGKGALRTILPLSLRRELRTKFRQWNVRSYKPGESPVLAAETREHLRERYRDDLVRLQTLTGLDTSKWQGNGS